MLRRHCRMPPISFTRRRRPRRRVPTSMRWLSRHADFVKIWVDNLHGTKPSMDPAIYRAVIDQAHHDGLHVAAHVYYLADAKALVSDGVDVLAHSVRDQTIDEELLAAMKQRGVFYIPTLTVDESFFAYAEHPEWKNDALLAGWHGSRVVQHAHQRCCAAESRA